MKVDLHIHSCFSDGKYSPSKIVEYAVKSQLAVISLTDHDTVAGLQEARQALRADQRLTIISGVEISTFLEEDELHILGYGLDETHVEMQALLAVAQSSRRKRVARILDCLKTTGIQISMDDVRNGYRTESLGRMHIAHVLIQRGYVKSIREAFDRYLSYDINLIEYCPGDFVSSEQAIRTILDAGGIPVFAHPTIALFDRYLAHLVAAGLQGVEIFKSSRPSIEEYYLETVAKHHKLLVTGGSDWHGYHQTSGLGSFYVDSTRIQPFLAAVTRGAKPVA